MDALSHRGVATTLVLLILRDTPSYGYQLVTEIRARSRELLAFGEGTIYPLLHGLEASGMIAGTWKPGTGERRRKVYRLTARGARELENRLADWKRLERAMGYALGSS